MGAHEEERIFEELVGESYGLHGSAGGARSGPGGGGHAEGSPFFGCKNDGFVNAVPILSPNFRCGFFAWILQVFDSAGVGKWLICYVIDFRNPANI
jgi:hypothetical protein